MRARLLWAVVSLQLCTIAPWLRAESRFERGARRKQEIAAQVTSWPSQEPIMFSLRRGNHGEDIMQIYDQQDDPANIRLMADMGLGYTRLHFYKGFGLDMEMPEIRKSQKTAELLHQLGVKVSLYVAGTMFVEALYREIPEAVQWEQRDQLNRPVYYSDTQTYRHFACFNEPKYKDYLKKVVRIGVEQIKADQIFFDNVFLQPEPKSCRCPRCISAFKAFLKKRYPAREAAFRRFGYPDPDYIVVNDWDVFNSPDNLSSLDDPILQEWTRFRCETVARHCAELYDFVKSLNPKISVGFNVKGTYGLNRIWRNGVYHPLYKDKIDFTPFDIGGMEARLDARTGALVSEIRSYKMARTVGYSNMGSFAGGATLEFALQMAFNPQKHIAGYGWQGGAGLARESERSSSAETEFFREYSGRYFAGTESVADVAVLRTWPSMAYSIVSTLVPTILVEQVLIQHHVPFDIIFDEQMDRIGRYRAVILPGQESLSKAAIDRLIAYARDGGTFVFTGDTARYNEWREARKINPLLAFMDSPPRSGISVKAVGKGKVVYIPEIVPGAAGGVEARKAGAPGDETAAGRARSFAGAEWVLPKNHAEILRAVAGNLRAPLSITTEAPLTTVMEILNRAETSETVVHFVNFDLKGAPAPFAVRLRNQFSGRKAESVKLFTPQTDDPKPLEFTEQNGVIAFTAPGAKVYSMIVVAYK